MCQVLNIPVLCVIVNFRKYDRVLNFRWDEIMEEY